MANFRYSSKDVVIRFGTLLLQGYAEDSFVTIARNEDSWTTKVGASGETTRNRNANKSGKVTVKLMASSPANAALSALLLADETVDGSGVFPIAVADGSGSSLYGGAQAWISKPPDADFAKEVTEREWVFEVAELNTFNAGNFTL